MHRPPAHPLPKSVAPELRTESVWDYPRPPVVREVDGHVTVDLGGVRLVDQRGFLEVVETSHPPTVYLPRSAFPEGSLVLTAGSSWCEFKGRASYADVLGGAATAERAAWFYLDPSPAYAALRDHVALYPGRMDACTIDGELVRAQDGDFYGGWITSKVTGPFKGAPGTLGW
jgi:uncharacterized protein (DUF427 family)